VIVCKSEAMQLSGMDDDRWPAALRSLTRGGSARLGDVLTISARRRSVRGYGEVRITIYSNWDPRALLKAAGENEIAKGLELVDRVVAVYPSLGVLLRERGVDWRYVYRVGRGSVEVATVNDDGVVIWSPELMWDWYGEDSD
jgi:hypothetical protein